VRDSAAEEVLDDLVAAELLNSEDNENFLHSVHRLLRERIRDRLAGTVEGNKRLDALAAFGEKRAGESKQAVTRPELRRELTPLAALAGELRERDCWTEGARVANLVHFGLYDLARWNEGVENLKPFADSPQLLAADADRFTAANSNLALTLQDLGDLTGARERMEKAIEIWKKNYEPDHPTLAVSYSNLAAILQDLGDLTGARGRMEKAIAIEEKNFEPDHPTLAVSYNNYAYTLWQLDERAEAVEFMRRAVEIRQKKLPEGHPGRVGSERALEQMRAMLDDEGAGGGSGADDDD